MALRRQVHSANVHAPARALGAEQVINPVAFAVTVLMVVGETVLALLISEAR